MTTNKKAICPKTNRETVFNFDVIDTSTLSGPGSILGLLNSCSECIRLGYLNICEDCKEYKKFK